MKVLIISSEAYPFTKTGGVADVVYGLARQLNRNDLDVRIVIPAYRGVLDSARKNRSGTEKPSGDPLPAERKMTKIAQDLPIPLWTYRRPANIWKTEFDHQPYYLVENEFYFEREKEYGFVDDYERFIFFCRAALEMLIAPAFKKTEEAWFPDIIHGFNSITGVIPPWLGEYGDPKLANYDPRYENCRFILSLHNLGHAGMYNFRALQVALQEKYGLYEFENKDRINLLGRGLLNADGVILSAPVDLIIKSLPLSTANLVPEIERRSQDGGLISIPNGIDYVIYDPAKDGVLGENKFSQEQPEKRQDHKRKLQNDLGFETESNIPLIGIVSRLASGRGFDLLEALKPILVEGKAQLVILADEGGDKSLHTMLDTWMNEWDGAAWLGRKRWMQVYKSYDDELARRIYGGCDLILMPFRHAPSSTQQLIAMRYGAVPLVFQTGALEASVLDESGVQNLIAVDTTRKGVGFTFNDYTKLAYADAVERALRLYGTTRWRRIVEHNMSEVFSWKLPAVKIEEFYTLIHARGRRPLAPGSDLPPSDQARLMRSILEIDGLPGVAMRNPRQMLRQSARLVRWVAKAEAVYFWLLTENLPPLPAEPDMDGYVGKIYRLSGETVELVDSQTSHGDNDESERDQAAEFLDNAFQQGWTQFSDSESDGLVRSIPGVGQSTLGKKRKWREGRSVTITAHSRVLGRIDLLFTDLIDDEQDAWYRSALTALASSFGQRLETLRSARDKDQAVAVGRRMLTAVSLEQTVDQILNESRQICGAEEAWLFTRVDRECRPYAGGLPPEAAQELAGEVLNQKTAIYQKDWATSLNGRSQRSRFRSFLAFPLLADLTVEEKLFDWVMVVAAKSAGAFTRDQEHTLTRVLGPYAVAALGSATYRSKEDENRSAKLSSLAASLVGGGGYDQLLTNAVRAIALALRAEAASLYLVDKDNPRQVSIQATYGYHDILKDQKVSYVLKESDPENPKQPINKEGMTAFIVRTGTAVKFNSLQELHECPAWGGLHKDKQNNREPNAFMGLPLIVKSPLSAGSEPEVIGVLKLEDRPEADIPAFNMEEFGLGQLMASMLATVVYNFRLAETNLKDMNQKLERLSTVMTGGREQRVLFQNIIDEITAIMHADAASLYLLEQDGHTLSIRAASGYQIPLLARGHAYDLLSEQPKIGVTAAIARDKQVVKANSLAELRAHPEHLGANNPGQGNREPNAFLGIPLLVERGEGKQEVIGVLKVEEIKPGHGHPSAVFTDEDVVLVQMMGSAISAVIETTRLADQRLRDMNANLQRLSAVMTGGREQRGLFQQIIDEITRIMNAAGASLYLLEPDKRTLKIQAASGYQSDLLSPSKGKTYDLLSPERRIGVTAAIARDKQVVRANSLAELRSHPQHLGANNPGQDNREPNAFLGIPLMVERGGNREVIGVLKVEDINPGPGHPLTVFTDEDVVLVQMMGSAITAVIENTRLADERLLNMNANLERLTVDMTIGLDQNAQAQRIIDDIRTIMRADAASLYLLDPDGRTLRIRAASGYQEALLAKGKTYDMKSKEPRIGVTAAVARDGVAFRANSLSELRAHPQHLGANNPGQENREPNAFLGIPLLVEREGGKKEVIGVLKVEDIRPGLGHPDPVFTDQDVALVKMMGAVIAANFDNTRRSEARLSQLVRTISLLELPLGEGSRILPIWQKMFTISERAVFEGAAQAFYQSLGRVDFRTLHEQTRYLLNAQVPAAFISALVDLAPNSHAQNWFAAMSLLNAPDLSADRLLRALDCQEMFSILENGEDRTTKVAAAERIVEVMKQACGVEIKYQYEIGPFHIFQIEKWRSTTIQDRLSNLPQSIPLIIYTAVQWQNDGAVAALKDFFENGDGRGTSIALLALPLAGDSRNWTNRDLKLVFDSHRVDVFAFGLDTLQNLVCSSDPLAMLLRLILGTINITLISPYRGEGPAARSMFFGREGVLAEITSNISSASYAIIGARKVGKTSILHRLHQDRLPMRGYRTVMLDLYPLATYDMALAAPLANWVPDSPTGKAMRLGDLLDQPDGNKMVVLLLDEADKIIPDEENHEWRLFRRLRALHNEGRLRVVMCGEMGLNRLMTTGGGPNYNFTTRKLLPPLDLQEVEELVTRPMEDLRVELTDPRLISQKIFDFSNGHPAVVQYLCGNLLERIHLQKRRYILPDDVDHLTHDRRLIQDGLINLYLERAGNLERIITVLMATTTGPINLNTVQAALLARGMEVPDHIVTNTLTALVEIRSIFANDGLDYVYAVRTIQNVLHGFPDLRELLLRTFVSEYKVNG
jgi:starch synthase